MMTKSLADLISIGLIILIGEEGKHWEYYETDPTFSEFIIKW